MIVSAAVGKLVALFGCNGTDASSHWRCFTRTFQAWIVYFNFITNIQCHVTVFTGMLRFCCTTASFNDLIVTCYPNKAKNNEYKNKILQMKKKRRIENTNGIWMRRDSKDHHRSRRGCIPIVNSLIGAIQCHIRRVCNLDFVRHQFYCWNFHRTGICSMVHSVSKSNCLWHIRDHRSNSVAIDRLLSFRI